MKKFRTVLVVISAIYIVLTIIFLLNDEALYNQFNLLKLIDYLQAWILVGLILLAGVIIVGSMYIKTLHQRYKKLEAEHKSVKARLFDIEEERKGEISRSKAEEEETERKLGAFNESLKKKEQKENPAPEEDKDRPAQPE